MSVIRQQFEHPALIKPFADYCRQQGWQVQFVTVDDTRCELCIDESHLPLVSAEFARFMREPSHPRYQSAAWELAETGVSYGSDWAHQLLRLLQRGAGRLTWLLALSCIAVFVMQQVEPTAVFNALMFFHSWPSLDLAWSWRWFSPALLHLSAAHLLLNLSVLLTLGGMIERQQGAATLALVTFIGGVSANIAQFWLSGPWFAGFSGVSYAIVGFYFLMGWRAPTLQYPLAGANFYISIGFMLAGFADVLWVRTANWAHLMGLVSGLLLAAIYPRSRRSS